MEQPPADLLISVSKLVEAAVVLDTNPVMGDDLALVMSSTGDVYTTGMEHSPKSAMGTVWESTPWRATQQAAWEALRAGQNV